jgi:Fic family protein
MKFLEGLSEDIKTNLLEQLRVLWTHTSTAIEGNTLTLGETAFILREGLTVSGKPLKDHKDVEGHARAVDFMYELVKKDEIAAPDLFTLQKLIVTESVFDVYKPVGDWKKENNSVAITLDDKQEIIEYSNHWEVPQLMERWLHLLNAEIRSPKAPQDALRSFARLHVSLVSIHPFWDGNGRMARLISNLPCLKAGYPPVIIEKEKRYDYIRALAAYQLAHGVPSRSTEIIYEDSYFVTFCSFCEDAWQKSMALVEQAHALQCGRDKRIEQG